MIDVDVAELLPHDGNMVLLDKVIEFDQESMVCEVVVRDDGLFGDSSGEVKTVPAWLGIEYMAQTVAALDGMMCKLAGKPINLGFLLGTRRYICNIDTLTSGTILRVKVKRLMEDQGLAVFECEISGDGIEMSAKLNVYQPDSAINKVITGNEKSEATM